MCLILFAYDIHPNYRLILAANRDEFYQRPTLPLHWWPDSPDILAGRDLKGKGTWLGINRGGRLAAITNYRDPAHQVHNAPSRGRLVENFLKTHQSPGTYLKNLSSHGACYNGYNLVCLDNRVMAYFSNRGTGVQQLAAGFYGLSNDLLNIAWPKVALGKQRLQALVESSPTILPDVLFDLLCDTTPAPDHLLPNTGVSQAWERVLSPIFIISPTYGTRSSSVILLDRRNHVQFLERTFKPDLACRGANEQNGFEFQI